VDILPLLNCEHVEYLGYRNQLGRQLQILDWVGSRQPSISMIASKLLGWERSLDANTIPNKVGQKRFYSGFFQDYAQVEFVRHLVVNELSELSKRVIYCTKNKISLPKEYQFAHIRRGDLAEASDIYGMLDISWYEKNRNLALPLIISTDDVANSRKLIDALQPELILDPRDFSALETLFVMGKAKDLIMANSTLSWWGAFLNSSHGGISHFPDPFYKDNRKVTEKLCAPFLNKVASGL
jgi:hypothetical protein